jgi:hypothetical protein
MNAEHLLWDFFEGLILNSPVYIALAVGVVILLTRWERHPAVSLWGALGFAWLFLTLVVSTAWNRVFIPEIFPDPGTLEEQLSYVLCSILEAVGYAFLIAAVVLYRHRRRHPYYDDHDDDHDRDRY